MLLEPGTTIVLAKDNIECKTVVDKRWLEMGHTSNPEFCSDAEDYLQPRTR